MPRTLARIPVIVAALWIGLLAPSVPGPVPPVALGTTPVRTATVPSPLLPEEVEGGSVLICALTGILFGAAVMSGNALAAGGAVVSAINQGCLW